MIGNSLGLIWKGIKGFGLFWVDFIIGDSPEIAIGVVIILGVAFAIRSSEIGSAIVIPAAVILLFTFGVWRGRNR